MPRASCPPHHLAGPVTTTAPPLAARRPAPAPRTQTAPLPRSIIRKKPASWVPPVVVLPLTARRHRNGSYRIKIEGHGRVTFDRIIADQTWTCAVTGKAITPMSEHLIAHTTDATLQRVHISIPGWEYLEARAA